MSEWIARTALDWYASWLPVALLALGLSVFVLAPLSITRRANSWATGGMIFASYVIGFTTWLLGAGLTFSTFGWPGLLIGLVLAGVGVVPIGAFGAYFKLDLAGLAISILLMAVVAYGLRIFAIVMRARQNNATARQPKHDPADAHERIADARGAPRATLALDAGELLEADGTGLAEPPSRK